MKKPIHSRLFIFLLCLFCLTSRSQIICTDVNPDINNSGNASLDIDLNNDATPDFRITSAQVSTLGFVVVQAGQIGTSNYVLTTGSGSAQALALNAPIGSSSTTWSQMNSTNMQMVLAMNTTVTGTWAGATDQYLGLRFIVGSNTYYGWARFSFSSSSNAYTFKDYAYQSAAGQSILAGQGCATLASPDFYVPDTVCQNSAITLTANTGTATASSYSWVSTPSASFGSSNSSITTITFSASGVHTVALGVIGGTTIGAAAHTLQVIPVPTLAVTVSPGTICQGSSATLIVTGNATSYTWYPSTGLSATTGTMVVASPTVLQNYHVVGTDLGCSTTPQPGSLLVLNPANPTVVPSSLSLCANPQTGSPSTVNLSILGASGYSIFPPAPGAFSFSLPSPGILEVGTAPPYTYSTSQVGFTFNISNGVCTVAIPYSLTVVSNPTVTLTPASPSLCAPNNFTLQASGANAFAWLVPPGSSIAPGPGGTATVFVVNAQTIYTVIGISNGCQSSLVTSTLTQFSLPALSAGAGSACAGQPGQLHASGAITYTWSGPNNFTASVANPTTPPASPGNYIYYVYGLDAHGCKGSGQMFLVVLNCDVGIVENERLVSSLGPNPASQSIHMDLHNADGTLVQILSADGRTLISQSVSPGETQISLDVGILPKGLYLVCISRKSGVTEVYKLLKE